MVRNSFLERSGKLRWIGENRFFLIVEERAMTDERKVYLKPTYDSIKDAKEKTLKEIDQRDRCALASLRALKKQYQKECTEYRELVREIAKVVNHVSLDSDHKVLDVKQLLRKFVKSDSGDC
jgi:hypothetical protein